MSLLSHSSLGKYLRCHKCANSGVIICSGSVRAGVLDGLASVRINLNSLLVGHHCCKSLFLFQITQLALSRCFWCPNMWSRMSKVYRTSVFVSIYSYMLQGRVEESYLCQRCPFLARFFPEPTWRTFCCFRSNIKPDDRSNDCRWIIIQRLPLCKGQLKSNNEHSSAYNQLTNYNHH